MIEERQTQTHPLQSKKDDDSRAIQKVLKKKKKKVVTEGVIGKEEEMAGERQMSKTQMLEMIAIQGEMKKGSVIRKERRGK